MREYNSRPRGVADWMIVSKIILINVVLFFANGLLTGETDALTYMLCLTSDTFREPWMYWKVLTYGFVHTPSSIWHLAGNMLGLFFLGYEVEHRLGSREFLYFYITTIIFGGVCWELTNLNSAGHVCLGASGGVVGVVVMYAVLFPHRTLLLYGIFPIPAWLIGVFVVGSDVMGILGTGDRNVAYMVHIAGAVFALLYFNYGWNISRACDSFRRGIWKPRPKKPKMSVYRPDEPSDAFSSRKTSQSSSTDESKEKDGKEKELGERVDEILKKYARYGEGGLSEEERDFLKKASNEYQKKFRK